MRFPADPPPGPKKKVFDPEGDCRKNGDVMFPTGTPLLVRLKMLLAFNEKFTEYGRWTGGLLGGFCSPPLAGVVVGPPGGGDFGSIALPNLIVFPTLMFTETKPGARPKLRGIIVCPGEGVGSNAPSGVTITPGSFKSVANAGRSVKNVSPFVSRPVVMLKGWPEFAIANMFTLIPPGAE
jgi:hypothetical protein